MPALKGVVWEWRKYFRSYVSQHRHFDHKTAPLIFLQTSSLLDTDFAWSGLIKTLHFMSSLILFFDRPFKLLLRLTFNIKAHCMHDFFYRVFLAFINPLYPLFMLYGIDEWIDQRSVGVIGAYSQSCSEASSSRGWTVQSSCSNVARISDDMALPDSAVLILILRRGEGRAEDARRLLSVWLIQRLKGRALTVKNMF